MMTKLRFISLLLVFALFISLSSPASAASNPFLIDLKSYELGIYSLDFTTYGSWQFRGSSGELYFQIPDYSSFAYVDIIFSIIDGDPGLISFSCNGTNLTAEFFGNNKFIRVYGAVDYADYEFPLYIDSDSIFLASVSSFHYSEVAVSILDPSYNYLTLGTDSYSWPHSNSFFLQNSNEVGSFDYTIVFDNWQAYDYLDFSVQLTAYVISGITVQLGDGPSVPFTHTFVGDSVTFDNTFRLLNLGIDLSGIERSLGSSLYITIAGSFGPYPVSFQSFSAGAFVRVNSSDSSVYWYQKIIDDLSFEISSWFEELVISVSSWGSSIVNSISSWGSSIVNGITRLGQDISLFFSSLEITVSSWGENIVDEISFWGNNLQQTIISWSSAIVDTVFSWGENIYLALVGNPQQDNPLTGGGELEEETDNLKDSLDSIEDNLERPDISDVDLIPVDPDQFLEPTYGLWVDLLIGEESPFNAMALISVTFMLGSYVLFGKRR